MDVKAVRDRIADAHIVSIDECSGDVVVRVQDWQELEFEIKFIDVIGLHAYSPEGEGLCRFEVESHCAETNTARERRGEAGDADYSCFKFISAWSEQERLIVVANSFVVIES